ncbi:MAG: DEAD/DEAH box helicase [Spirochaetes bacterium]|nr:DEAD/DEAH box helicase [Spirochaetota bacterium]
MSFSRFQLRPELLSSIKVMGFAEPTPIQTQAIPPLLEGRDLVAAAATGSGKTAAFLLPVMDRLAGMQRGHTRALVLVPTRELAAQIVEHFKALTGRTGLTAAAVHGGVGMGPQVRAFRTGVDLIVATPGRLLDHLGRGSARLSSIRFLVLDEADRMLDMGFLPDIRRILEQLPRDRQTMLFSATIPTPIAELSRSLLQCPVRINIERVSKPAAGITHAVYPVSSTRKPDLMVELLHRADSSNVLVFTRTKNRANRLAGFLEKKGVACERIHGNRSQSQRTAALDGFKHGRFRVLVATDIAARGIDVEALGLVVNFDVPHVPEDYIHRVGRTARAELTGDAFTLVSPEEEGDVRAIERHLGKPLPRHRLEGFDYAALSAPAAGPRPTGSATRRARPRPRR